MTGVLIKKLKRATKRIVGASFVVVDVRTLQRWSQTIRRRAPPGRVLRGCGKKTDIQSVTHESAIIIHPAGHTEKGAYERGRQLVGTCGVAIFGPQERSSKECLL